MFVPYSKMYNTDQKFCHLIYWQLIRIEKLISSMWCGNFYIENHTNIKWLCNAIQLNGIIIFYYLWRKYEYLVVASKYAIVGTQGICLPTWRCQSQESILTNWGTFTQNAYNCLVHCICLIHTLECRTLTLLYMLCRWNSYFTINIILSLIWNKIKLIQWF